jgi:hypothetical protein
MTTEKAETSTRRWGCGSIGCLFMVILYPITIVIDGIASQEWVYRNRYWEERYHIEDRIKGDPAFSKVEYGYRSNGGTQLRGTVATKEDRARLLIELGRAIGEPRAQEAILGVEVRH